MQMTFHEALVLRYRDYHSTIIFFSLEVDSLYESPKEI